MERNSEAIFSIASNKAQGWFEKAIRIYIWGFIGLVIIAVALVALGVRLNGADLKGGNFYIAAVFLVTWAFFTFYPACLAIVFGLGGLSGLPQGWSFNQLIRQGVLPDLQVVEVFKQGAALVKKYAAWSAHLALFMVIVFVTLGTWDIKNASVVLPIFVVLAGIGLWTLLFTSGTKWYKRIVMAILLVSLGGLVYTGYIYTHPQSKTAEEILAAQTKNEDKADNDLLKKALKKVKDGTSLSELSKDEKDALEKARRNSFNISTVTENISAVSQNLFYERTIEIEVSSFRSKEQCGILVGKRTFELPNLAYIFLEGDRYDLTSMVRVNGRLPKESFVVGNDGCVQISFVASSNHQFPPQLVRITFR